MIRPVSALFSLLLLLSSSAHADAFGAPGIPHRWASALKQAVGTAYEPTTANSPVWFTVADGVLTEVFYPNIDQAQVGDLQFLVTDGQNFFSEQKRDTISSVSFVNEGMTVRISGQERSGRYAFEQEIVTDTAAPVVRIHTTLRRLQPGLRLFVLFKPAINNTGSQNLGFASHDGLFATKLTPNSRKVPHEFKPVHAALLSSNPWVATSVGYVGFSDGWQDISKHFSLTNIFYEAGPGNIALTGEVRMSQASDFSFDLALGFGGTRSEAQTYAQTSLLIPFDQVRSQYEGSWKGYLQELQDSVLTRGTRFITESVFARRSAEIIKMHEDKYEKGAIAASFSKPAPLDNDHAMDGTGGYHVVWPRDLYHAAMGLLAAGDVRTPINVLHYFLKTQRADGSWPQNFWVDGTPYWRGLQMDQVAFPILLAAQLQKRKVYALTQDDLEMIRKAAAFIISHGPSTQQDRWEELGGYSPSTIAAEIAALKEASLLTNDPTASSVADRWQTFIETWTLVQKGPLGQNYYLRISPAGSPDEPEPIDLANGAGKAFAAEIIDGGFLELIRMRLRSPSDPRILNTMSIYESPQLGVSTKDPTSPGSMVYRRYNRDVYGAEREGGFWPLLAGERGHFAVAAGNLDRARAQLFTLERSAIESDLIPEQTITPPLPNIAGAMVGRGVACPLVWAHAEDILLHRSIEEGKVFDAPVIDPLKPLPAPSEIPNGS